MSGMWRSRWAAVGAAVAITLGAGGLGIANATTSSGEKPIYKPITPCRLADTRPAPDNVGGRTSPIGPEDTYTLMGWGTVGNCFLPNGTAGLALNVTAVAPSQETYLTIYPTGAPLPLTSNLNPAPGEPPTPNAVNVDLNGSGQFNVFNKYGSVHVVVDVVGYYDDHHHDDRYYTETEVDAKIAAIPKSYSPWDPIPSGLTVTGWAVWDSHGSADQATDMIYVTLPGKAPVPLTDEKVNFDQPGVTGDGDPQCTGTPTAPTAPAGKVCIYLDQSGGMDTNTLKGWATWPPADAGFLVNFHPNGIDNVDQFVYASWAYTAP